LEKKKIVGLPFRCSQDCETCPQEKMTNCPDILTQARLQFFHSSLESLFTVLGLSVQIVDGCLIGIFSGDRMVGSILTNLKLEGKIIDPKHIKFMKVMNELIETGSIELGLEDEEFIELAKDNIRLNGMNYEVEKGVGKGIKISVL